MKKVLYLKYRVHWIKDFIAKNAWSKAIRFSTWKQLKSQKFDVLFAVVSPKARMPFEWCWPKCRMNVVIPDSDFPQYNQDDLCREMETLNGLESFCAYASVLWHLKISIFQYENSSFSKLLWIVGFRLILGEWNVWHSAKYQPIITPSQLECRDTHGKPLI